MAKVLLLLPAGTYRATDFIDAARDLADDAPSGGGDSDQVVDVVVVTDAASSPASAAGSAIQVDFAGPEVAARTIVDAMAGEKVVAVVAADDVGVLTASHTRELLGLPGNPPEAVMLTRDKAAMRDRLAAADVSQPDFVVVPAGSSGAGVNDAARSIGFPDLPVVVKPVGLSGSRGVIRVDRPAQLHAAVDRARGVAADAGEPDSTILIERYIAGAEVAVDGMVDHGAFSVLAVFDKPDAPSGPYFEETYYVTPSVLPADALSEVSRVVAEAAAAIGIVDGPVHAEARIDSSGRVWILELAARSIGGLCSRSLRFGLGVSLETLILRHALHLPASDLTRESASSGVLMLPIPTEGRLVAVNGQDEARAVFGIQGLEITIPVGRWVKPLPEGDRYLGFMFARGPSPEAVESTLRDAFDRLDIVINP